MQGINQEVFGARDVLAMEGSGRLLKFTFNTALLEPLPVYGIPIPDKTMNPVGVVGFGSVGIGGVGFGGGVVGFGGGVGMY